MNIPTDTVHLDADGVSCGQTVDAFLQQDLSKFEDSFDLLQFVARMPDSYFSASSTQTPRQYSNAFVVSTKKTNKVIPLEARKRRINLNASVKLAKAKTLRAARPNSKSSLPCLNLCTIYDNSSVPRHRFVQAFQILRLVQRLPLPLLFRNHRIAHTSPLDHPREHYTSKAISLCRSAMAQASNRHIFCFNK